MKEPGEAPFEYVDILSKGAKCILDGDMAIRFDRNLEQAKTHYRTALSILTEAEKRWPNEAGPKLQLAEASTHLWETEDPTRVLEKISLAEQLINEGRSEYRIDKFDAKDTILYLKALCHLALKDRDTAKSFLREALVVNPKHKNAKQILEATEAKDTEEKEKKGGCFIATAAFGSELAPEVCLLREFRDNVLLASAPGQVLVRNYYRLSPPIANAISRSSLLKSVVRQFIRPLIFLLRKRG
jgi:tetratricopeptide (TPR) repeat protein